MNLHHQYWYFQKAVPDRICDEIKKYAISIKDQMAVTGGFGDPAKLNQNQIKNLKKKRDSDVVWLSDRWVYKEIQPYVRQANASAGWNFEWDWSEACQFTKYTKGGDFEVDFRDKDPDKKPHTQIVKKIRPKGSLIVFPSDLWHRVKPVTKGVRYSLVIWNLGGPFK